MPSHNVYYITKLDVKDGRKWGVRLINGTKVTRFARKLDAINQAHDWAPEGVIHLEGPRGWVRCTCQQCHRNYANRMKRK
jgi:alkyl sulfatase BDS1-like metallo-beta-lactamase superfamily hydrolase